MKSYNKKICVFGSYDETILSNRVIVSGIKHVVPNNLLHFVHVTVPKSVLYDQSHLGITKLTKRIFYRLFAQIALLFNFSRVISCDVVIILPFGLIDLIQAWVYKTIFGKKIIYIPQNSLYDLFCYASGKDKSTSIRERVVFHFERLLWRIPDVIVFNSYVEADEHKNLLDLPNIRTAVIPLGAEDTVFFPSQTKKITRKKTEVLFYGEYNAAQGTGIIVQAASLLQDIHFTMIGEGKTKQQALDIAKQKKLRNVTFIGWQSPHQLLSYIHNADIVLGMFSDTPVSRRAVPNKVFQGLACQKAVITGYSPACASMLQDRVHVYYVQMDNPDELAKAIKRLAKDSSLRDFIAKNGYSQYLKYFTPKAIAKSLMKQIKEAL